MPAQLDTGNGGIPSPQKTCCLDQKSDVVLIKWQVQDYAATDISTSAEMSTDRCIAFAVHALHRTATDHIRRTMQLWRGTYATEPVDKVCMLVTYLTCNVPLQQQRIRLNGLCIVRQLQTA
jgi:hypothetical protein